MRDHSHAHQGRRFRTNPVEWAIFSIVTLIFFNSVYNLFYDRQTFRPSALMPVAANPVSEGRSPASITPAFMNVDLTCGDEAGRSPASNERDTQATKVRIIGPLCGLPVESEGADLLKTAIVNTANQFSATVFTDTNAGKFSTDYIPLNAGKNPIHVEFTYRGGRVVAQDVVVTKN